VKLIELVVVPVAQVVVSVYVTLAELVKLGPDWALLVELTVVDEL